MKFLITGATGLLGRELGIKLVRQGHEVHVITRQGEASRQHLPFPCRIFQGDLSREVMELSEVYDGVFHLMGEPVAEGRWNPEKKKSLVDSRVVATRNLRQSLRQSPRVLMAASAIGFYGHRGEEELDEHSPVGAGFLAELCENWETEVSAFSSGTRKIVLRIGIVLAEQGGALAQMIPLFQKSLGAPLSSGQQWMSWIHLQDVVEMFWWSFKNSQVQGVLNAVAPKPLRNIEFTQSLAQALGTHRIPRVPGVVLKTLYGEMGSVVLASQKVLARKSLDLGFQFQFSDLESALKDVCALWRDGHGVLKVAQFFSSTPAEVFPFFSDARNLQKITPEQLHVRILSVNPEPLQSGTLIDYRLRIRGIPVYWRTRIENWQPPHQFVDTQLRGPYVSWHHTHRFEEIPGGTLMTDVVRYKLPVGLVGRWVAGAFVRSDVEKIFDFRRRSCHSLFSKNF
ncbi:MAG: TIGR01777 family oxidoreductase [Bdellovibrio sp.]